MTTESTLVISSSTDVITRVLIEILSNLL